MFFWRLLLVNEPDGTVDGGYMQSIDLQEYLGRMCPFELCMQYQTISSLNEMDGT